MKHPILQIILLTIMTLTSTMGRAQEISADFPFKSQYLKVDNHQIHYIDEGSGGTVLFLHGVPMSSYSWRNVIPHLSDTARCIALDFMGFGKSDKPDISYTLDDQYHYLSSFIDALGLKNITLVMTDVGGILGQKYARMHPDNVKGMVLMETPITDAESFHKNGVMMQRMMFNMAGKDKFGHRMFVKKNMFIKMMPRLIKRKLSKAEKEAYATPFNTQESRMPMFMPPNSFPRKGRNATAGDMADYLNRNAAWLVTSSHPKLVLRAKPGMLMNKKVMAWAEANLQSLQTVEVGKAKHLMEEDLPFEIGMALRDWYLRAPLQ